MPTHAMNTEWIRLQSIPPEGIIKQYTSRELWESIFTEFTVPCVVVDELVATVEILPQNDGVFFKGSLRGTLAMPCDRCTEESRITLNENFAGFEVYPDENFPGPVNDDDSLLHEGHETDEAVIRPAEKGNGLEINPLAYAWEELSLALPVKPLCSPECKGLCPVCGCNNNTDTCNCEQSQGDSRFAALRKIKISR